MKAMEDTIQHLRSFPPSLQAAHQEYDTHAREFIASTRDLLVSSFTDSDKLHALLDNIDPSSHSLSYLLVLHILLVSTRRASQTVASEELQPGRRLWTRAIIFLNAFDPNQIRYASNEWCNILDFISKASETENKPFLAVRAIRNAILRLDPTCSSLTVAHVYLTRMCLLAGAYKIARPVIDQTIFSIPNAADQIYLCRSQDNPGNNVSTYTHPFEPSAKLAYTDHLKYFLYGGMIYMALKDWSKARHFLSIVISSPVVNAISLIMVEAYKKWVLVNLLENGTVSSPPKVISPIAMKVFKALGRPYDALAATFVSGKWEKLRDEAEFGRTIWRADKNSGLVDQVLLNFRKQAVRGLGSTFAAVTTVDVSERALSKTMDVLETERYIMALAIQEGLSTSLVHPSKEPKTSMLRFLTDRAKPSIDIEISLEKRLRLQHQNLELLFRSIQASDRKLELSKEYINHLRKAQKRNDVASKDGGFGVKTKEQNFDVDEDMMDDLQ